MPGCWASVIRLYRRSLLCTRSHPLTNEIGKRKTDRLGVVASPATAQDWRIREQSHHTISPSPRPKHSESKSN